MGSHQRLHALVSFPYVWWCRPRTKTYPGLQHYWMLVHTSGMCLVASTSQAPMQQRWKASRTASSSSRRRPPASRSCRSLKAPLRSRSRCSCKASRRHPASALACCQTSRAARWVSRAGRVCGCEGWSIKHGCLQIVGCLNSNLFTATGCNTGGGGVVLAKPPLPHAVQLRAQRALHYVCSGCRVVSNPVARTASATVGQLSKACVPMSCTIRPARLTAVRSADNSCRS